MDDAVPADAEAVFLALPHGAAAQLRPGVPRPRARRSSTSGPDFRLRDPPTTRAGTTSTIPRPELLAGAVYGLPELHRAELAALGTTAAARSSARPAATHATLLALAPLARAGLIGDLVVDAKSGVSGAGRDAKPDMRSARSTRASRRTAIYGHRHIGEIEQELARLSPPPPDANPGASGVDFLPHLIPMTRGILSACHVRPTRPVTRRSSTTLYAEAYADEPFVTVVDAAPATKHVARQQRRPASGAASTSGPAGSSRSG